MNAAKSKYSGTPLHAFIFAGVGCIVGLLVAHVVFGPPAPVSPPPATSQQVAQPVLVAPTAIPASRGQSLSEIERHFLTWGGYAVWEDDVAEFAIWNSNTGRFSRFYAVTRKEGAYYFRRLSRLTRPLIDHGARVNCPVWFTETAAMREAFYRDHPNEQPSSEAPTAPNPPLLPPRPPNEAAALADQSSSDPLDFSRDGEKKRLVADFLATLRRQEIVLDGIAPHSASESQARKARGIAAYVEERLQRFRDEQVIDDDEAADLALAILRFRDKLAAKL